MTEAMTTARRPYRADPVQLASEAFYSPWTPTETEMTRLFLRIAQQKGWPRNLRYHTHNSRRSERGYPDWHLIHPAQGRSIFVELKGWGGSATDEQRRWCRAINDAGGEAYIVGTTGDYAQDAMAIAELLSHRPARRSRAAA